MPEFFFGERIALHCGDCRDVLATLADCSVDSCVTDPPYHLVSIVKRFGAANSAPVRVADINATNDLKAAYARQSAGFMGKQWDGGDIAFRPEVWAAVYRVLKPGAHLLAFGGTRTYHRMACAIEDAGFEIRDSLSWNFGSGFPKSHDVSKGIDRAAGAEREIIRTAKYRDIRNGHGRGLGDGINAAERAGPEYIEHAFTAPATDAARQWAGWGTALKPAMELIVLARKPLSEGTVAANVLKWGTGALNIDGCRIKTEDDLNGGAYTGSQRHDGDENWRFKNGGARQPMPGDEREGAALGMFQPGKTAEKSFQQPSGRWPANVIHDGSEEVVAAFPETNSVTHYTDIASGFGDGREYKGSKYFEQGSGSAARFFYTAKADSDDRIGSKHPTVKPLDLIQYLVRLITPRGGLCLDPFSGTGTLGEAAFRVGMRAVLIEREEEYQADIRRRMKLAAAGPDERARESIKAKNLPRDDGPLFDWSGQ